MEAGTHPLDRVLYNPGPGHNFIDTAYDYQFAEEWIGRSLKPRYGEFRDKVWLHR